MIKNPLVQNTVLNSTGEQLKQNSLDQLLLFSQWGQSEMTSWSGENLASLKL